MPLTSFSFLFVFLPLIVALNWKLLGSGRISDRKWLLLASSVLYYFLSSAETLPILAVSLLINYYVASRMRSDSEAVVRKRWLILGLSGNIALLAIFKYTHFVLQNVSLLAGVSIVVPDWVFPLGVSFYTIQQVIYLVDCYEGMVSPVPFLEHSLFISFFPCIAAGPILRAGQFIPQLETKDGSNDLLLSRGLMLLIFGLTKKAVLAESFRHFADAGFADGLANAPVIGMVDSWITGLSYTFQIYFDFSGYSDIVIGIGLMLSLGLPLNFNSPLKATSLIDFWKRWHMTLSSFITTYLYTPMARAIRPLTFAKAMVITMVSMSIAGLWHGPAWTFLIFGGLHGLGLIVNNSWRKTKIRVPQFLSWLLTFAYIVVAFVVFRAGSWDSAWRILSGMAGAHGWQGEHVFVGISRIYRAMYYTIMLVASAIAFLAPNSNELLEDFRPSLRWSFVCAAMLLLSLIFLNSSSLTDFIYRDF